MNHQVRRVFLLVLRAKYLITRYAETISKFYKERQTFKQSDYLTTANQGLASMFKMAGFDGVKSSEVTKLKIIILWMLLIFTNVKKENMILRYNIPWLK